MKAYQRQIRELEDTRDPRPVVPLDGCAVERVTPAWAAKIVLRYEWLQTMPTRTVACYGLVGPGGEPLGVSVFGYGGGSAALDVCGRGLARAHAGAGARSVRPLHARACALLLTARAVSLLGQEEKVNVVMTPMPTRQAGATSAG